MRIFINRDAAAGTMLASFGVAGIVFGWHLDTGSAANMGPGYLPRIVSLLLVGIGAIVAAKALFGSEPADRIDLPLRPVATVCASLLLFMVLLKPLGLVAAIAGSTVVAAFNKSNPRALEVASLIAILSLGSVLIFVSGLGLPLPVWPEF